MKISAKFSDGSTRTVTDEPPAPGSLAACVAECDQEASGILPTIKDVPDTVIGSAASQGVGFFVFFEGKHCGWTRELFGSARPSAWRPGCVAIPADGTPAHFVATGGDYQAGAERWESLALANLRARMLSDPTDVRRVLALAELEPDTITRRIADHDGRRLFRYLIETPFASFPRFVVGITDEKLELTAYICRCGQRETAEASFATLSETEGKK